MEEKITKQDLEEIEAGRKNGTTMVSIACTFSAMIMMKFNETQVD